RFLLRTAGCEFFFARSIAGFGQCRLALPASYRSHRTNRHRHFFSFGGLRRAGNWGTHHTGGFYHRVRRPDARIGPRLWTGRARPGASLPRTTLHARAQRRTGRRIVSSLAFLAFYGL